MKSVHYFLLMTVAVAVASCNSVSYQKTKSGVLYKIISSNAKDSVVKDGQWLKFYYVQKLNDSVMQDNYGKMPAYAQVTSNVPSSYSPVEIFGMLRKGDSAVTVLLIDTLLKKGQLPPFMKKGDRLTITFKVLDIITSDSAYQADATREGEKDKPRQMKEAEDMKLKAEQEMEKSGEVAKGLAQIETYLKEKNISAVKTGKGTFVFVKQQGTGPQAAAGKYVTVKYSGRTLEKDSVFDSGVYPFQLGTGTVIPGWDEGLEAFKQGGSGTLYVPGFRGYGDRHPRFKPYQAMIFDVEMLSVSDTMPAQAPQPMPQRRN